MKKISILFLMIILISACDKDASHSGLHNTSGVPIQLHPDNPHYFLYKGKTLALVSSAEHYGAVINLDFDFDKYLKTLAADGMNYTRIFTGSYFEIEGESFGIHFNTLAPDKSRIITPWNTFQSESGDIKYDLSQWNDAYFKRLKEFVAEAAELDIIVEVTLFSSIYRNEHWDICPQNPANNINIPEEMSRFDAQTMNNGTLLEYQESFVRKMVDELNEFNNFFFEIQNEPWSDHAIPVYNIVNKEELRANDWSYKADFADEKSIEWQEKIASIIVDAEDLLPKKHLIAQNFTNFKAPVPKVEDHISIINFHYAWPEAVEWNLHYDRVIGFDESGFAGSGDQVYRRQAWQFMLSGGGLFNNLDYSFFVGHEDGLGINTAPGGGSDTLRRQLRFLSDFLKGFELEKLKPNPSCIEQAPGLIPYALSDKHKVFAIYLRAVGTEKTRLQLDSGKGSFQVQKINPITGSYSDPVNLVSKNGSIKIDIEIPDGELALKIVRTDSKKL